MSTSELETLKQENAQLRLLLQPPMGRLENLVEIQSAYDICDCILASSLDFPVDLMINCVQKLVAIKKDVYIFRYSSELKKRILHPTNPFAHGSLVPLYIFCIANTVSGVSDDSTWYWMLRNGFLEHMSEQKYVPTRHQWLLKKEDKCKKACYDKLCNTCLEYFKNYRRKWLLENFLSPHKLVTSHALIDMTKSFLNSIFIPPLRLIITEYFINNEPTAGNRGSLYPPEFFN